MPTFRTVGYRCRTRGLGVSSRPSTNDLPRHFERSSEAAESRNLLFDHASTANGTKAGSSTPGSRPPVEMTPDKVASSDSN
jgi:hypothetical protein